MATDEDLGLEDEAESGSPDIVRQRKRIRELEDENKSLRDDNLKHAFREAGFNPVEGSGKLLFQNYRGERSAEAILEWADKEFGLKPSKKQVEEPVSRPVRNEAEQGEVAFEARLGRARQEAIPPDLDKIGAALAEARKRGDVTSEVALQLLQWEQTKT